jgi:hypothetical protein
LLIVVLALLGLLAPLAHATYARQATFIAAILLLIGEFALLGRAVGRGWAGVIIDSRNVMSLSRLQMCLWTVLVLSALLVGVAFNVSVSNPTALGVSISPELVAAMGISATSLAATPALLSLKTGQTPTGQTPAGQALADQPRTGTVAINNDIRDAAWTDVITGDEVGNQATADLGKIQQLLVSLLLIGAYGVMVWYAFAGAGFVAKLPPLDPQFVWLLGVSHASYLAYKAAPHTPTA